MRRLFLLGAIEALAALSVTTAAAASVTFQFQGTVTAVENEFALLDGSVTVGTLFSGFYTFESTSPDRVPDPNGGVYQFFAPASIFHLVVGNYTFETLSGQSYAILVENPSPLDGRDLYLVSAGGIGVSGPIDPALGPYIGIGLGVSAPPPGRCPGCC